jgi:hypothetical protein
MNNDPDFAKSKSVKWNENFACAHRWTKSTQFARKMISTGCVRMLWTLWSSVAIAVTSPT